MKKTEGFCSLVIVLVHQSSKLKLPILKLMSFLPPLPRTHGMTQEQSRYVPSGLGNAGEVEDHREQSCCGATAATFICCSPENNFKISVCRCFVPYFILCRLLCISSFSLDLHVFCGLLNQEKLGLTYFNLSYSPRAY